MLEFTGVIRQQRVTLGKLVKRNLYICVLLVLPRSSFPLKAACVYYSHSSSVCLHLP